MKNSEKIAQIIEKLNAKGFKTEASDDHFGYTNGRGVWHWFELLPNGTISFKQSYSQNTGRSTKSFSVGFGLAETLKKRFGAEFVALWDAETTDFADQQAAFDARYAEAKTLIAEVEVTVAEQPVASLVVAEFHTDYTESAFMQFSNLEEAETALEKIHEEDDLNQYKSVQLFSFPLGEYRPTKINSRFNIWNGKTQSFIDKFTPNAPLDQPAAVAAAEVYNPLADRGIADDVAAELMKLYGRHVRAVDAGDQHQVDLIEFNQICREAGDDPTSVFTTLSVEEDWLFDNIRDIYRQNKAFGLDLLGHYVQLTGKPFNLGDDEDQKPGQTTNERIRAAAKKAGCDLIESASGEYITGRNYKIRFNSHEAAFDFAKLVADLNPDISKSGRFHIVELKVSDPEGFSLKEVRRFGQREGKALAAGNPVGYTFDDQARDAIGLNQAAWFAKYSSGSYLEFRKYAIKRGFALQTNSFPALASERPNRIIKQILDFTHPGGLGAGWMRLKPIPMEAPDSFINFLEVLRLMNVEVVVLLMASAEDELASGFNVSDLIGQDLTEAEQVAIHGPESEKLHDSVYMEPEEFVAKHHPELAADQPAAGVPVDEFPALAAKYPGGRIIQVAVGLDSPYKPNSREHLDNILVHFRATSPNIKEVKVKIRLADGGSHFCRVLIDSLDGRGDGIPADWAAGFPLPASQAPAIIAEGWIRKFAEATAFTEPEIKELLKDLPCGYQRAWQFLATVGRLPDPKEAKAIAGVHESDWQSVLQVIANNSSRKGSIIELPNPLPSVEPFPGKVTKGNQGGHKSKYHN